MSKVKRLKKLEHLVTPLALEPWTPFARAVVPERPELEVWKNSRYQVTVKRGVPAGEMGLCIWLSIKTLDRSAWHDWRDLQRIKNELVGPEVEAVELFPAESRLVDGANQFHLWCFPKHKFPFGFDGGRMVTEEALKIPGHPPSRNRPFDRDNTRLWRELEKLEAENPDVKKTADALDRVTRGLLDDRDQLPASDYYDKLDLDSWMGRK